MHKYAAFAVGIAVLATATPVFAQEGGGFLGGFAKMLRGGDRASTTRPMEQREQKREDRREDRRGPGGIVASSTPTNVACVQTAVTTREATLLAAFNTYSSAQATALSARGTALTSAWGQTDAAARRAARNAAWDAYKQANKSAASALRSASKSAWDTFRTASKTCGVDVVEEPMGDMSGAVNL